MIFLDGMDSNNVKYKSEKKGLKRPQDEFFMAFFPKLAL